MAESIRFQHFEVPRREDGSLHELGRGAMGITYKAFDTNLRCFVALKVINATYLESETARQRFLREARAAAALRHPNVATVFYLGEEGGDCFYAMEYVDGETVEALMKRMGPIPAEMALKITLQVTRALSAAQKQNLVHRDIKPSNLMIVREEDSEFTVKVIDFGLAKNAGGAGNEEAATLTMGGFLGTPHFASPEQLEERELDVRSDIYSLGVTLFYMLAGRAPFSGSIAQVMSQHLHREPPLEAVSHQPAPVINLLRHMLAKDPAERPQTPAELRREIEECLKGGLAKETSSGQPVSNEDFETQADTSKIADSSADLSPGIILAGRYRILQEVKASDHGRVFRAESLKTSTTVALLLLNPSLLPTDEACDRLENQVVRLQKLNEPSLQKILSFERYENLNLLVLEWIDGPTLLDLMRNRRVLPFAETLPVLRRLASGFEALQHAGLPCPDISAHEVMLAGGDINRPVTQWQHFTAQINALTFPPPASDASEATLVTSTFSVLQRSGAFDRNAASASVYVLAVLAYEMLGGIRSRGSTGAPIPIPGISEASNAALRQALDPTQSFPSTSAFLEALETSVDAIAPAAPPPAQKSSTPPPPPASQPKKIPALIASSVAMGLLLAGGGFFLFQKTKHPPLVITPSSPTPTPEVVATPDPLVAQIKKAQENFGSDPGEALRAMVEIAKAHRNNPHALEALKSLLKDLRKRADNKALDPGQLAALRRPLELASSELDLSDAEIMLANQLKTSDPTTAFSLLQAAADNGDNTEAILGVGLAVSNGLGTPKDPAAAIDWFQKAADLGDPLALFYLADCYLHGVGVAQNQHKAVQLLKQASEKQEPKAMNALGGLYDKGISGILEKNFSEAFRLLSAAAALGELDAQGNLGSLYYYGRGVAEDQKKALQLWRDGAEKGNGLCMYFYAMALEIGVGGASPSKENAQIWYVKAAEAGDPKLAEWCRGAQEWCRKNNVPFTSKSTAAANPTP